MNGETDQAVLHRAYKLERLVSKCQVQVTDLDMGDDTRIARDLMSEIAAEVAHLSNSVLTALNDRRTVLERVGVLGRIIERVGAEVDSAIEHHGAVDGQFLVKLRGLLANGGES